MVTTFDSLHWASSTDSGGFYIYGLDGSSVSALTDLQRRIVNLGTVLGLSIAVSSNGSLDGKIGFRTVAGARVVLSTAQARGVPISDTAQAFLRTSQEQDQVRLLVDGIEDIEQDLDRAISALGSPVASSSASAVPASRSKSHRVLWLVLGSVAVAGSVGVTAALVASRRKRQLRLQTVSR